MSNEKMREEFESAWRKDAASYGVSVTFEVNSIGFYVGDDATAKNAGWWAWQTSRSAIEIELPERAKPSQAWGSDAQHSANAMANGFNHALAMINKSIINSGLKVKP